MALIGSQIGFYVKPFIGIIWPGLNSHSAIWMHFLDNFFINFQKLDNSSSLCLRTQFIIAGFFCRCPLAGWSSTSANSASSTCWCSFPSPVVSGYGYQPYICFYLDKKQSTFLGEIFFAAKIIFQGMNQLLWYYADLEKQKCLEDMRENVRPEESIYVGGKRSSKVIRFQLMSIIST